MRQWIVTRDNSRIRLFRFIGLHHPRREEITPEEAIRAMTAHVNKRINIVARGYEVGAPCPDAQVLATAILLDFFGGNIDPDVTDARAWIRDKVFDNFHMFTRHLTVRLKVREGQEVTIREKEIRAWLDGNQLSDRSPFIALREQLDYEKRVNA